MISEAVLEAAVARAAISAEQAQALRAIAAEARPLSGEPQDEERLRFISGFGDIFVTIGLALFLGATSYFLARNIEGAPMWIVLATLAWLLAEFFTRRQRMALPSIVLLIVFATTAFMAVAYGIGFGSRADGFVPLPRVAAGADAGWVSIPALATVGLVALHYWRFRVPITVAAGAAAFLVGILSLISSVISGLSASALNVILLSCGCAVFAGAMAFDIRDPGRLTRRTDIAFWLHMLAAPLIVHPLVRGMLGATTQTLTLPQAAAILAVFLLLAIVALVTDRRAILVSGLLYAGYAFGSIVRRYGFDSASLPATLLALGAFVLVLSAGWRPLRALILRALPVALARRLPHPVLSVSP